MARSELGMRMKALLHFENEAMYPKVTIDIFFQILTAYIISRLRMCRVIPSPLGRHASYRALYLSSAFVASSIKLAAQHCLCWFFSFIF